MGTTRGLDGRQSLHTHSQDSMARGVNRVPTTKSSELSDREASGLMIFTAANFPFTCNSGFRVQGSGFRVQGSGFRVQGSGIRVQGSGFRVQGSGFTVQGPEVLQEVPLGGGGRLKIRSSTPRQP